MWRASVLTIFPEMFPGPLGTSLAGKALAAAVWAIEPIDIRNYAGDRHRSVDDTPAGGGPGMVMRADVLARAHRAAAAPESPAPAVVERARQAVSRKRGSRPWRRDRAPSSVRTLRGRRRAPHRGAPARGDIAGRLRAFRRGDCGAGSPRCLRAAPSRGDGQPASGEEESFAHGLLEYPQYTRPQILGRPIHSADADQRRSRQGGRLAARRGRADHPGSPPRSLGGLPGRSFFAASEGPGRRNRPGG